MKIGLSCEKVVRKYGYEQGLKIVKESGFDAVDIEVFEYCKNENGVFYASEDEFLSHFYDIKKLCDDLELEISQTHGLCTTCTPDEEKSNQIKLSSEMSLKATSILEAPYCIFHNATLREFENTCMDADFMMRKNKEFFDDFLTPLCRKYNVKFALETHGKTALTTGFELDYFGDGRNLRKSFDEIESDFKSICVDTGHTNEAHYYGGPTVYDTIKLLGKDISTLHLHDNQGVFDSHLMPILNARNSIDWESVFGALEEVGYNGVYNWELNLKYFGNYLDKAMDFIGGYLRTFTENKGKL